MDRTRRRIDTEDIADDDNVIWIGDLSRDAVFKAWIAMDKRRRERAREEGAAPRRIEIRDGKDPIDPDQRGRG